MDSVAFSLCENLKSGRFLAKGLDSVSPSVSAEFVSNAFTFEQDGFKLLAAPTLNQTEIYKYNDNASRWEKFVSIPSGSNLVAGLGLYPYRHSKDILGMYCFKQRNTEMFVCTITLNLISKVYNISNEVSLPFGYDDKICKLGEYSGRIYFIKQNQGFLTQAIIFSFSKGSTDFQKSGEMPVPPDILLPGDGNNYFYAFSGSNKNVVVYKCNFLGTKSTIFNSKIPVDSKFSSNRISASRIFKSGRGFGFVGRKIGAGNDETLFRIDLNKKTFEVVFGARYSVNVAFGWSEILDNDTESVMTNGAIYYNNYPNEIEGLDTLKSWIASR